MGGNRLCQICFPSATDSPRLLTNADLPGVEKVGCCDVPQEYLDAPADKIEEPVVPGLMQGVQVQTVCYNN